MHSSDSSRTGWGRGWRASGILLPALAATVAVYAVAVWFGELNQDEGWYLYAGRQVAEGRHPFIDFASTQGPLMAYVYAAANPLVAVFGVLGGRLFTAALGVLSLFLAGRLAARLCTGPSSVRQARVAMFLPFAFLGCNLYHAYFTSMVKTYALTSTLVMAGFLCLSGGLRSTTRGSARLPFAAGFCLALATGVRLSAGILLPVVAAWLLFGRRAAANGEGGARRAWNPVTGFALGGLVGLAMVFLPFVVAAPDAVRFGLLDYHGLREAGTVTAWCAYKVGFVMRLAGAYFPLFAATLVCAVAGARWPVPVRESPPAADIEGLLRVSFVAITLVHLAAPFPYDDYQVFAMPLLAVVISARVAALSWPPPETRMAVFASLALALATTVHAASSPLLQSWLLAPRDRIWWPLRPERSLAGLRRAARLVASSAPVASVSGSAQRNSGAAEARNRSPAILTQDLYLAVETGRRVPDGMELGPFCYFPEFTDEQAAARHVLNRAAMETVLRSTDAPVAAFSAYGLAIRSPSITELPVDEQAHLWAILQTRYAEVAQIDGFGQASTVLRIFRLRPTGTGPHE